MRHEGMGTRKRPLVIVSRKQWRYLKMVLDSWDEIGRDTFNIEHEREAIRAALLAADYDTLPEKAGEPAAKPMPKAEELRPCACGECGLSFSVVGQYRKYHPECPARNRPKAPRPRASKYRPHAHYDPQWELWAMDEHCQADHTGDFAEVRMLMDGYYVAPSAHDELLKAAKAPA